MKFIGALVLGTVVFAYGFCLSQRFKNRRRELEAAVGLVEYIKNEIRLCSEEYGEILRLAAGNDRFDRLTFLKQIENCNNNPLSDRSVSPAEIICRAIDNDEECCLNDSDRRLLKDFFMSVGTTDREGQINNCRIYRQRLDDRLRAAAEEEKKKYNLYKTLFTSLSAAVFILAV